MKYTNHSLVNGISGFVREDAGGQTGDNFYHIMVMSCLQHVVIDVHVVSLKYSRLIHVYRFKI